MTFITEGVNLKSRPNDATSEFDISTQSFPYPRNLCHLFTSVNFTYRYYCLSVTVNLV